MVRKIKNDEQFMRSVEWLVEKAYQIEHPLMDEKSKAELIGKYDYVSERVIEYRKRDLDKLLYPKEQVQKVNLSDWLNE
ncbi:hypothetical protein NW801_13460 [Brevibacillus laterosporus]|uniref:Uncharacterized protein n=1 Tax=Brevibacillus halotolerans TaxID=1507437 RepID=A0ABT4HY91_9BACL|nr:MULTISPECIES: hypothetical protein [Brevibacillus]MCR8986030.1 hypothetical protein [Brevibacillus laterosporus]MCZ0831763.1 hypothetical protein [Brevibacillus halotolerans]GIO03446.1 hypothetical protein J5TS2_41140 [Brevibacillus halotolerans]